MAKKKSFEDALDELEAIVQEMESGELKLEEAVKKYELGIRQSRYCLDLLDKTEARINQLTRDENQKIQRTPIADKNE